MAERVVRLGEVAEHLPSESWLLVLGGVTREGNRLARRAIRNALKADMSVLWFDGYSERSEVHDIKRLPLDVPAPDGRVLIVDYAAEERGHWLNRMVEDVPDSLLKPVVRAEDLLANCSVSHPTIIKKVRRVLERAMALVRKKILRRLSLILRGRVGWRIVSEDLAYLSDHAHPPIQIVYGDDYALTIGWHAARLWPKTRTSMEYEGT